MPTPKIIACCAGLMARSSWRRSMIWWRPTYGRNYRLSSLCDLGVRQRSRKWMPELRALRRRCGAWPAVFAPPRSGARGPGPGGHFRWRRRAAARGRDLPGRASGHRPQPRGSVRTESASMILSSDGHQMKKIDNTSYVKSRCISWRAGLIPTHPRPSACNFSIQGTDCPLSGQKPTGIGCTSKKYLELSAPTQPLNGRPMHSAHLRIVAGGIAVCRKSMSGLAAGG